jgi:two-component system NarL family sensor kinase
MSVRFTVWLSVAATCIIIAAHLGHLMLWRAYEGYALGILTVLVLQTVLIGYLQNRLNKQGKLQTDLEKSAAALKESEAKNRAILEALPDMMFLLDENGTYLDWHAKDRRDLFVPPEMFLGKNMRDVLPRDLSHKLCDRFQQVSFTGEPATVEYSMSIGNRLKFFETRIVKCGDGKLLSIARNVTEKKQAELQLQQLSSRLLRLQDEERRRIARELHDITAQNLFAITVNLENLRQQQSALTRNGMETVTECLNLCEQSLREVRTLSYVLHPPALDRLGLVPTLQWYIDGFAKRSGIAVRLESARDIGRLPLEMETDIFRIVQEGLSNVFRHSGSQTATVVLEKQDGHFVLQIRDSGHGMPDWNVNPDNSARFGVGLPSIRERLRRLGGQLDIRSGKDGVLFQASMPVPHGGRLA